MGASFFFFFFLMGASVNVQIYHPTVFTCTVQKYTYPSVIVRARILTFESEGELTLTLT